MSDNKTKRQFNIRIPIELKTELKNTAERLGVSMSALIRDCLKQGLAGGGSSGDMTEIAIKKSATPASSQTPATSTQPLDLDHLIKVIACSNDRSASLEQSLIPLQLQISALTNLLCSQNNLLSSTRLGTQPAELELAKQISTVLTNFSPPSPLQLPSPSPTSQLPDSQFTQLRSSPDALTQSKPSDTVNALESQADSQDWLTPKQAFEIARRQGYSSNQNAFIKLLTESENSHHCYAQYGLTFDLSRRGSRGQICRWFRRLIEPDKQQIRPVSPLTSGDESTSLSPEKASTPGAKKTSDVSREPDPPAITTDQAKKNLAVDGTQTAVICPYCKSTSSFQKRGKSKSGVQRYFCNHCQRKFLAKR